MSDELFESFEQLLALSDRRGIPFDRCLDCCRYLLGVVCHVGVGAVQNVSLAQDDPRELRGCRAAEYPAALHRC